MITTIRHDCVNARWDVYLYGDAYLKSCPTVQEALVEAHWWLWFMSLTDQSQYEHYKGMTRNRL